MTHSKMDLQQYKRIIESTARQIKDRFGLPSADAALREASVEIRRDQAARNIG